MRLIITFRKVLGFASARGSDGKNQVWISRFTGGDPEQLTTAESGVNSYKWSPDSKRIAYTMNNPEKELSARSA